MRKAQKQEVLNCINSLHQAHKEIKEVLNRRNYDTAQKMLSECQEFAVSLGESIEDMEGEECITVSYIEEYCEVLFRVFEEISNGKTNENKLYKILNKQLLAVENSVKDDISVKKEVVFFPYKASMWDSLESVYLAAKEDPECDAYCVPIPYYDLNPDRSFGRMHYEGDEYPENIEITDWQKYNFEERKPDVIYIHNPYDNYNLVTSVHPRFYSSNLKKHTDTLVYVPYYSTSGGMSEAQSLCPAYIYADYIVIQSPKFRSYFDKNIPDRKFLPFGSPKFDRVINKCKNQPEPPLEWKEKIAGRKVFFYNTSISEMLADTEVFLKKMNYVFECFEGREDVCLLWRPHPLLEASFDSMRPQYRHIYDALKKMFLEKNLGILDTTPDIADSVALSDAYIGGAGTSVTSLFGVVGKPVFILNNGILSKPGEDSWRKRVDVVFDFQEQHRFSITQGNKLYMSEPWQYDYRYYCDISDNRRREYSTVLEIDGIKYACPAKTQDIIAIKDKRVERKIELTKEEIEGRTFKYVWKYGQFLILYPLNYPAVVRYDTVTGKCSYYQDNIDVFIKEKDGQKIVGGSNIYRGNLYCASPMDNMVWKLDIENGKAEVIEIPIQSRCGCNEFVEYKEDFWMLPYRGKVIVRWNPQTGETREYRGISDGLTCIGCDNGHECEESLFSSMAFYGDYLYLAPQRANMYLRMNIHTGQFEQWKPPFEYIKEEKAIKTGVTEQRGYFLWWKPEETSGWLKIYDNIEQKRYNVNLSTNDWKEIEIKFDIKELEDHEEGFCECSETLKYGCMENIFNSLDRFLDGKLAGRPFDREKQLAAYQEIAVNTDGSCGRKVYEYIKAHG